MDIREKALWFLVLAGLVLLVAATPSGPSSQRVFSSHNLLFNGDFESGEDGHWEKGIPLDATDFHVVPDPLGEDFAASLSRNGPGIGEVYFYQDVGVAEMATYSLSGWVHKDNGNFSMAGLRIQWWGTVGPSLDQRQVYVTENASDYRFLEIESDLAPEHAVRARIIAYAIVQEPSPETPVFFDDLSFSLVSDPPTPTPTLIPSSTPTPTPVVWPKILLNEILPSPRKKDWNGDGQKSILDEWVELYNATDAPVDLGGWILDDIEAVGSSKPYLIPAGTIIAAKGRIVLFRSETHITLNDDGDTVRLLHPDGTQADKHRYKKTPGYDASFSRKQDGAKKWTKKCAVTMGTANCK